MSNAARKQLGIQPDIVRNTDKYPVLPTHDLHVGQQVMYQDSTSKHWYPAVIKSKKKSQVNNQTNVQTSRPKRDTKPPVIFGYIVFDSV